MKPKKNAPGIIGKRCDVCGNEYENPITVIKNEVWHTFDCFECAIHALAPKCEECHVPILGHGIQAGSSFYCSAHCARRAGCEGAKDHLNARLCGNG